jgi:transposase
MGANVGALVIRLRGTLQEQGRDRGQPRAQADTADRHRRVVVEKKHRQWIAVIVDHDNRRVLEVLESREKAVVLAYLQQAQANGMLADVEEVTTDMWDGYVEAAKEAFGPGVRVATRSRAFA